MPPAPTHDPLPWVACGSPSPQLPPKLLTSLSLTFVAWAVGTRPPPLGAGWLGASVASGQPLTSAAPSVRGQKGDGTSTHEGLD